MRVWTEHYGCTLNQGETLILRELALQAGHTSASSLEEAEMVIFGSCIVIDQTERKMWRRLQNMKDKKVIIGGCLPPISEQLLRDTIPDITIIPPGKMEYASEVFGLAEPELKVSVDGTIAVLPIATGCQGSCTFCITRLARGELASRSIETIVAWTEDAVKNGAKEIRLSAQDTGVYGKDIGTSLPALLRAVTDIPGDHMVRIGMMNPNSIYAMAEEMVEVFKHPRMFKFLHIPLQSGSNKILRSMGRNYTKEDAIALVDTMRKGIPNITISTDIIVGFPNETEEDFQKTIDMIELIQPDSINITRFSERAGTKAAHMEGKLHGRTSKARSTLLTDLRFKIAQKKKDQYIGTTTRAVIIEKGTPGTSIARDQNYITIVIKQELPLGTWVDLQIVDAEPVYFVAKLA